MAFSPPCGASRMSKGAVFAVRVLILALAPSTDRIRARYEVLAPFKKWSYWMESAKWKIVIRPIIHH